MAIFQQLPPFSNVVASGVATLMIPKYAATLTRIVLQLGGTTFTPAMITDIKVKIGPRTVYNCSGAVLQAINAYKGLQTSNNFLSIDFTERDAPSIDGKEIGGYDMAALPNQLTLEVTIAGATAPMLTAVAFLTPPQGQAGELVHKLIYLPASTSVAGKFPLVINPQGALIKRMHLFWTGSDWTSVAEGNVNKVEVKKNGVTVFELTGAQARFVQQEYRKVPQAKHFAVDFVVDNNQSAQLVTADAKALEVNAFLTAADGLNVYLECIDLPANL